MKKFILTSLVLAMAAFVAPANADTVEEFYKDRTVTIVIPVGSGGAISSYTRMLIPFLKEHMPGHPTFIVVSKPGGSGIRAGNYLFNAAPRDGSTVGMLLSGTALAARIGNPAIKFKPSQFNYLSAGGNSRGTVSVRTDTGVRSMLDAINTQVILGTSGTGSQGYMVPTALNIILGTKFKVIQGYKGMSRIDHAVEQGELQGRVTSWAGTKTKRPHWIKNGFITHLAIVSMTTEPDLPGVPRLVDFATNRNDREILELLSGNGIFARAYLAPPRVPAERVAALRTAFFKAFNDPEFLARAKKARMDIQPLTGEQIQGEIVKLMNTPQKVVDRTKAMLGYK